MTTDIKTYSSLIEKFREMDLKETPLYPEINEFLYGKEGEKDGCLIISRDLYFSIKKDIEKNDKQLLVYHGGEVFRLTMYEEPKAVYDKIRLNKPDLKKI